MDPNHWRTIPDGSRWSRRLIDRFDNSSRCHRRAFIVELYSEAREGVLRSSAVIADGGDRCFCFNGPVSVLPVLRSLACTDVLPDWYLGWRESSVRGNQVLSLHTRWIRGDAVGRA